MNNNRKEEISHLTEMTESKLRKYKGMSKLKTSKCILTEALKDTLTMAIYLEDYLDKKGYVMSILMNLEMEKK